MQLDEKQLSSDQDFHVLSWFFKCVLKICFLNKQGISYTNESEKFYLVHLLIDGSNSFLKLFITVRKCLKSFFLCVALICRKSFLFLLLPRDFSKHFLALSPISRFYGLTSESGISLWPERQEVVVLLAASNEALESHNCESQIGMTTDHWAGSTEKKKKILLKCFQENCSIL